MTGFRLSLEKRLIENKDTVLNAIKLAIDGIADGDMTCLDRELEKQKYVDSADAWVKHGVRMIRGVTSKALGRVGSYWETMNFLPPGVLKSSIVSNGTNKSALFANTAGHFNMFASPAPFCNTNSAVVGINALMQQVIMNSAGGANNDDHMNKLIAFTKIRRDKYKIIPQSRDALTKWLDQSTTTGSTTPSNVQQGSNILHSTPIANRSPPSPTTSIDSCGSAHTSEKLKTDSDHDNEFSINHNSNVTTSVTNKMQSLAVSITPSHMTSSTNGLTESVKFHMKELLKILYAGVIGGNNHMCLKLTAINNSRDSDMLSFMAFLDSNKEKSIEQLNINFSESIYFKKFKSSFFIPSKQGDRNNITGDGYCFYRAIYILFLRSQDGAYDLTADEMKILDLGLRHIENDIRQGFYDFFDTLNNCLPEEYGKSRVLQSRFLFFHIMNCSLDPRFWGVLDAVAYLPFDVTAFGEHDDQSLGARWSKYYCSSIFGNKDGCTVDAGSVGTSPTIAEIFMILSSHPNYVLFKSNHFFVTEHCTRLEMQNSFDFCVEKFLEELRNRFGVILEGLKKRNETHSTSDLSWTDICDRMATGSNTQTDVDTIRDATEILVNDLQNKQVVLEEEAEKLRASSTVNKKTLVDKAPAGASEDQKRLFTLNTKVILYFLKMNVLFLTVNISFVVQRNQKKVGKFAV
jgi:hypothetical protein